MGSRQELDDAIATRVLILDGAMGSILQARLRVPVIDLRGPACDAGVDRLQRVGVFKLVPSSANTPRRWSAEKNVSVFCSNNDDPNGPSTGDLYTGASVTNGGRFCDQRKFVVRFTNEFKASGSYPFPFGFEMGAVLQSYAASVPASLALRSLAP